MDNKHTIVYVMRHFDVGNNIDIPYKKVGITGAGSATLTNRLQQINNTKSPIQTQCMIAWSHNEAGAIENALHLLLEDIRVSGEWFLDKDDSLVERMKPIMQLLGAEEITIKDENDDHAKNILKQESDTKKQKKLLHQKLLGEIMSLLHNQLDTSLAPKDGLTIFGSQLTFSVRYRKSGAHSLHISKCKEVFEQLKLFLEAKGFNFKSSPNMQNARVSGVSSQEIANIINDVEAELKEFIEKFNKATEGQ